MREPACLPFAAAIALGAALLAGCSAGDARPITAAASAGTDRGRSVGTVTALLERYGGATLRPPLRGARLPLGAATNPASWIRPRSSLPAKLTYIADYFSNFVTILDRQAYLVGLIRGFSNPQGIFVDQNRDLWVANTSAQNVLEFARGATTPTLTLSDPGQFPLDVSVCPDGTVYVSNIISDHGLIGSISVYANGSTSPTGTLRYPGQGKNFFLACDSAGNVFTTLFVNPHTRVDAGGVVEYAGGKQAGAQLLPIRLQFPGGIQPYGKRNLLVNDQNACTVTEYTEAGIPTGAAFTWGTKDVEDWVQIAVTRDDLAVAGADADQEVGTEMLFPSGTLVQTYHVPLGSGGSLPIGIAFDPPQKDI